MTRTARLALMAGAVLIAAMSWQALQTRGQRPPLPVVTSATPAAMQGLPPLARDVLASGLVLSAVQQTELEALAAQWQFESTSLEAAVRAAADEFNGFVAKAQAAGRTNLAELQSRSVELRELSAELRARRQVQSDAALAVLTDAQRREMLPASGGMR